MRSVSCCGYVVPVSDLIPLFKVDGERLRELYEDNDDEGVFQFFQENYEGAEIPTVATVFTLGDDDDANDLETGNMYAVFEEDDLIVKTKRPACSALEARGVEPKFETWTRFC